MDQTLSISNVNKLNTKYIEYLDGGGFMELGLNLPQKRFIDCINKEEAKQITDNWLISELYFDTKFDNVLENINNDEILPLSSYRDIIGWCINLLAYSPIAKSILKEAIDDDWSIAIEDLQDDNYYIDVEEKIIILNNNAFLPSTLEYSEHFKNIILVAMVKALRDIWQDKYFQKSDQYYSPKHILLIERIRSADLEVISILIAWELGLEKYNKLWKYIISSEIGDMALTFSNYLKHNPLFKYDNKCLFETFKQWFRVSERVDFCDFNILEYINEISVNSFDYIELEEKDIEELSILPNKGSYLQEYSSDILNNQAYSFIYDEVNNDNLFHIINNIQSITIKNITFHDMDLAYKIFPMEKIENKN